MDKAVLISIRPMWCELIASGHKTIELRKTKPKLYTPFKCYIYETRGIERVGNDNLNCIVGGNGRKAVIGEFVCDKITEDVRGENGQLFEHLACVTVEEQHDYAPSGTIYGWHISSLVIYDTPKGLNEFHRPCKESLFCESCGMWSNRRGCGNAALQISRPPQSWCYVEEKQMELKPCPFCGSKAKIIISGIEPKAVYKAQCENPNCGGNTNWWCHRCSAVSSWNCREEAVQDAGDGP